MESWKFKSKIGDLSAQKRGSRIGEERKEKREKRKGRKEKEEEKGEIQVGEVSFLCFFKLSSDLQVVIKERSQRNSRNK